MNEIYRMTKNGSLYIYRLLTLFAQFESSRKFSSVSWNIAILSVKMCCNCVCKYFLEAPYSQSCAFTELRPTLCWVEEKKEEEHSYCFSH